jgi:glycosyltransferase involved in cell wall biosynthesis
MIAAVVPVYNEGERSVITVGAILRMSNLMVIAVDDGSNDNSWQKLKERYGYERRVLIARHVINQGKGAAMKTGAEIAWRIGAKAVIFIDADGQHNPKHLVYFIEELKRNDLVFGYREVGNKMPWVRRWGNMLALKMVRIFFGIKRRDLLCGFLGFSRGAYKSVCWQSRRYGVETEIAIKAAKKRLSFSEVKIDTIYLDKYKGVTLVDALKIFINIPYWYFIK